MLTTCVVLKLVLLALSVACLRPSHADHPNLHGGSTCFSTRADSSNTSAFKTNRNSLMSLLEEQGPRNSGFYKAEVGERPDTVYGLVQCRGDVSAQDCAACIKDISQINLTQCVNSDNAVHWFTWCFLRYSPQKFFGQWEGLAVGFSHENSTAENPTVISQGMNLMSQVTFEAPNQPFMFKTGSAGVGHNETRYGLAQCNRDLSKSSCGKCLTSVAEFHNRWIGNQSSWTTAGYGCLMSYNRYKFYFNYSLPANGAAPTSASHPGLQISLVAATAVFLLLLLPRSLL
uniref:Gnk2-homologous domain-containing protein n=1 Tax=Kalanchoe fedtschenkoi TaxID=63787 RepID=A0A7N0ZZS8_KALFE